MKTLSSTSTDIAKDFCENNVTNKKRKRVYGRKCSFARSKACTELGEKNLLSSIGKREDTNYFISLLQNKNNKICNCSNLSTTCCLIEAFTDSCGVSDLNALINCLKKCHEEIRIKTKEEREHFIQKQFSDHIAVDNYNTNSKRLKMDFKIFEKKVCRRGFAAAYNISKYQIDKASADFKKPVHRSNGIKRSVLNNHKGSNHDEPFDDSCFFDNDGVSPEAYDVSSSEGDYFQDMSDDDNSSSGYEKLKTCRRNQWMDSFVQDFNFEESEDIVREVFDHSYGSLLLYLCHLFYLTTI